MELKVLRKAVNCLMSSSLGVFMGLWVCGVCVSEKLFGNVAMNHGYGLMWKCGHRE